MAAPRFVHLRLHTEYSIVDGMARVDDAVAAAAADAMPALAVTDAANLFGAIKFYEAARAAGVQPIIGCDLWITNERNEMIEVNETSLERHLRKAGYASDDDGNVSQLEERLIEIQTRIEGEVLKMHVLEYFDKEFQWTPPHESGIS